MAENTPMPSGNGGGKLPIGSGKKRNPLGKKEVDILDPEAKGKYKEKRGLGDMINDAKEKIDSAIKVIKAIPPHAWFAIGIIILIIFFVGGYIGFFTLLPGLTVSKIKELAQKGIDTVQSWFTTEADAYVNEVDVVELANYLEQMDYDLIGYGFITPNSNYSEDNEYITYIEVIDKGYIYYERRDDDESPRYYNEAGEAYDGGYYNSLGILIDNSTGKVFSGKEYIDEYGIHRSTDEVGSTGKGKITGFGKEWIDVLKDKLQGTDWSVDTKLLRSYLLSDYKIYAVRNAEGSFLHELYSNIKKTFGGYDAGWSKGLMKFYYATNGVAYSSWNADWASRLVYGDDITISGTKMTVKNGHWNNPVTFDIEGWADRYGMSLEFLLSLHIATMQPDLVYAMLQSFDTEAQIYLNDSGKSAVDAAYVDMLSEENTTEKITLTNVENVLKDAGYGISSFVITDKAALEWVNGLAINAEKAQVLLKELNLTSPNDCERPNVDTDASLDGTENQAAAAAEENLIIETYGTDNWLDYYGIDDAGSRGYAEGSGIGAEAVDAGGSDKSISLGNRLNETIDTGYGYSGTLQEIINDNNFKYFSDEGSKFGYDESKAEVSTTNYKDTDVLTNNDGDATVLTVKTARTWTGDARDEDGNVIKDEDGNAEQTTYTWTTYKFMVYKGMDQTDDLLDVIVYEYIKRTGTVKEKQDAGVLDENGNEIPRSERVCSAIEQDECCDVCLEYVKAVIKALASISDQDYRSYTPYIARVLGSWFRDTYFVIPEKAQTADSSEGDYAIRDYSEESSRSEAETDMIKNAYGTNSTLVVVDEDYLAKTEEYWTSYKMNETTGDYQLYYLYPNGITSDYTLEEFLEDPYTALNKYKTGYAEEKGVASGTKYASQKEAEEAGHAFVKKAETNNVTELSNTETAGLLWSAYSFS